MPQLNKSEAVHHRLRCLLQRLIGFANYELTECESLERKISVRWTQAETSAPKLIVKTEIRFLAELVFKTAGPKTKENLKQDLRTLKDFLGLLEDNRDRTQGSGLWHFTLTLWYRSVDKNLAAFDAHWQRCKQKSAGSSASLVKQLPNRTKIANESVPISRCHGLNQDVVSSPSSLSSSAPSFLPSSAPSFSPFSASNLLKSSLVPPADSSSAPRLLSAGAFASPEHQNPQREVVVSEAKRNFPEVLSVASQRQDAARESKAVEKDVCVYHNLPGRDYGILIGREQPLQQILQFLKVGHPAARLSVTGVGGIGKTALVLDAAYECLKVEDAFNAVIFAVTKKQRFTPHGILQNYCYSQTLQDLFRTIAQTLKCPDALMGDFTRQLETIYELLSCQRTLLIIDNLETLLSESRQAVLSFLYGLPATVKVIVMSRLYLPMDEVIPLMALGESESMAFIHQQAQLKAVALSASERQSFYQQTYGMPAAMVYAMGQLAAGYSVSQVLPKLTLTSGDYCRYYLEHAVQALFGKPAFDLLIALSLFPHSAPRDALVCIAGLSAEADDDVITESFVALQQRSLIQYHHERYSMLPLTRDYVLASSDAHLLSARERWLAWYKQWLKAYDYEDWRVWHDYSQVDVEWGALQAVVEWCIAEDRYGDFGALWRGIKGYTHLRGLWNDRLSWLEGWLQAAQANKDTAVTMQVLGDLSWTLMLMGEPQQLAAARQYLSQAWAYSEDILTEVTFAEVTLTEKILMEEMLSENVLSGADSKRADLEDYRSYQLDLAIDQVVLFLFQGSLDEAAAWLEIANRLILKGADEAGTRLRAKSQQMRLDYYAAQLCYRQRNYSKAKLLYRRILQRVQRQSPSLQQSTQQQQAEVYSLNWLVDIALKEEDVKEADRLLQQSWSVIQGGTDLRSQAFHQRSKAKLEKRRGNLADFQHWSKQAKACFETLGMHPQAQEMHEWLIENKSRSTDYGVVNSVGLGKPN